MKNNRKLILGIIIGMIMMSGVGVVAAIFSAEDISFTPNDSSWEVTNVKEAMDSLYTSVNQSVKVVATGEGGWTDITASYTEDGYQSLETSDFQLVIDNIVVQGSPGSVTLQPELSYDNTTGIITITKNYYSPSYQNGIRVGSYHIILVK